MRPYIRREGRKRRRLMEMAPGRVLHMISRMVKLTVWEMPVAMAAPAVPRFRPKIRMGSRIMFRMPPVVMPTMPYMASPWKRSRLFITKEDIMKGVA